MLRILLIPCLFVVNYLFLSSDFSFSTELLGDIPFNGRVGNRLELSKIFNLFAGLIGFKAFTDFKNGKLSSHSA